MVCVTVGKGRRVSPLYVVTGQYGPRRSTVRHTGRPLAPCSQPRPLRRRLGGVIAALPRDHEAEIAVSSDTRHTTNAGPGLEPDARPAVRQSGDPARRRLARSPASSRRALLCRDCGAADVLAAGVIRDYGVSAWVVRRSIVSLRRIVEVALHGRGRPAEPHGDLRDRQTLRLTVMPRERHSTLAFGHAIQWRTRGCSHTVSKVPGPRDVSSSVLIAESARRSRPRKRRISGS
jgi:hypothetical protein